MYGGTRARELVNNSQRKTQGLRKSNGCAAAESPNSEEKEEKRDGKGQRQFAGRYIFNFSPGHSLEYNRDGE